MTKDQANEIKVGIVVLICLVLALTVIMKLSNWDQWFEPTNEITITAKHVSSVTLFLNDELVDLDMPVTVTCNGVQNKDVIPRNFTTMMRLIYSARNDSGRFYTAMRTYDVPKAAGDEEDEG